MHRISIYAPGTLLANTTTKKILDVPLQHLAFVPLKLHPALEVIHYALNFFLYSYISYIPEIQLDQTGFEPISFR